MQESYLSFYGLTSEPFSNAPVTRFYYESEQHKQALTRLSFALDSMKGLAVVIGGIGTGKTTLARRLLDALPDTEYEAALLVIIHSGVDASWLLKRIAMQLGVADPADEKLTLLSQLYQRLVQIYEAGKKAVVLIDEAQMLATRELMEEFRGLLNLEVPERKLVSLVFFGLPEIDKIMLLDPPLKQRVALKFRLEGLSRESTERYINHRLQLAGADRPLFTAAAIDVIFDATAGTPRLINTVCDNTLLEGFLAGVQQIDAPLVLTVVDNLGIDQSEYADSFDHESIKERPKPAAAPSPAPASEATSASDDTSFARPVLEPRPSGHSTQKISPITRDALAQATRTPTAPLPAAPAASASAPRPSARPAATKPVASEPRATFTKPLPTPNRPPAPSLEEELFGDGMSPLGGDSLEAPKTTLKKTTVNLDEIDSLLAQIKKPIA